MFGRKKAAKKELQPHEMGPPVDFKPKGGSDKDNQANLIKARQSMGIVTAKELFANAISRRADRILLDYTQQGVACGWKLTDCGTKALRSTAKVVT